MKIDDFEYYPLLIISKIAAEKIGCIIICATPGKITLSRDTTYLKS